MRKRIAAFAAALFLAGQITGPASADFWDGFEDGSDRRSELRLGVLAHDRGIFASTKEDGVDANVEVLFPSPGFLKWALSPRIHLGGSINTAGDTSAIYGGFTWTYNVTESWFVETSLGTAHHDGHTVGNIDPNRKDLGCHWLIRGSLSVGYDLTDRSNLSVMVDHMSNGTICARNEGIDNVGIRYGVKF